MPAYHYGRRDIHVLISEHADGQMIAEACRHLGFRVVRGSATRGGVEAVRQMVRRSRSAHLAITPDGPRGPRRQVQPGVVYLAAPTGLPIVPFGIAFERAWRMNSWDRFAVPWPWSGAVCVTAEPIHVPAGRPQGSAGSVSTTSAGSDGGRRRRSGADRSRRSARKPPSERPLAA